MAIPTHPPGREQQLSGRAPPPAETLTSAKSPGNQVPPRRVRVHTGLRAQSSPLHREGVRGDARRSHDVVPQQFVGPDTTIAPKPPTVWERYKGRLGQALGVIEFALGVFNAFTGVVRWPVWALAVLLPVLAGCVAATRTGSLRIPLLVTGVTAVIAAVLVLVLTAEHASRKGPAVPTGIAPAILDKTIAGYHIHTVIPDGDDVWGVSGRRTVLELTAGTLLLLGRPHTFPAPIEHVVLCAGELLATFGAGMLGEINTAGDPRLHTIRYGYPVPAGQATGTITCEKNSVYVALSKEALLLRYTVPGLELSETVHRSAERITGLVASRGVVFVEDSSQNAVITVRGGVPMRWKMTMPAPATIVLGGAGALLTHTGSPCVGVVSEENGQELGVPWSAADPLRLLATSASGGIAADDGGHLYRFGPTGELTGRPIRLEAAEYATGIAITDTGQIVLAVPSGEQLIGIPAAAWKPVRYPTVPARGCLATSE